MARLALAGGSYSARSIIANCQRCINLFPENNANASPVTITHYQRPGLRPLAGGPVAPVRNLYRASNGNGYCTIGSNVYAIDPSWNLQQLGTVTPGRLNPVSMIDNGVTIMVVDGSPQGWTINMATNEYSLYVDPSGLFRGATRGDYIDSFMLFNVAGTPNNEFISTLSGVATFDPTYFAFKTAYPDPLMALIVNRHEILLIGQLKTEVWYNGGLATFPFLMLQGVYHEHGTLARYSVASLDISVFFLGSDLQGNGVVYKIKGYSCLRVSNYAIEYQIRKMRKAVGIDDAIGYTYQQDGHYFYVLHFPKGDQTWVLDDTIQDTNTAWHQEGWTNPKTGVLHRHRANCHAFINDTNVVGDWQNGTIYEMDLDQYVDNVNGVDCGIQRLRTFPHVIGGEVAFGIYGKRAIPADGRRIQFTAFFLDMELGLTDSNSGQPLITLRYSDDKGRTYSSDILQHGGEEGEYLTVPTWRGLGIARDRVFEVEYAFNGPAAMNGAWVEGTVLAT